MVWFLLSVAWLDVLVLGWGVRSRAAWHKRFKKYAEVAWLAVFIAGLAVALALVHAGTVDGFKPPATATLFFVALGAYLAAYLRSDLTSISLHRIYKRRLSSAFALERRGDDTAGPRPFKPLIKLSETAFNGDEWPTLLVCASANVSDVGATPRGRAVTSWTFSAGTVGGPLVGAIETGAMEDALESERRQRDLSLPAAVAMSGAALSPSMGKLTKKPLRFLLALANVRLGVWVPNPGWSQRVRRPEVPVAVRGQFDGKLRIRSTDPEVQKKRVQRKAKTEVRLHSSPRLSYLFREALERNYLSSRYLYVTDGGHYENLGLVELLRRGCTEIYCFDASAGHDGSQLGDAIALARSELQVEIDIDPSVITGSAPPVEAVVEGQITYARARPRGGTARLFYCTHTMTSDPPWDVRALASRIRASRQPDVPTALRRAEVRGVPRAWLEAAGAAVAQAAAIHLA